MVAAPPTIVCLDRDPSEADGALLRPGRRVVPLSAPLDGPPGTVVGVVRPGEVGRAVDAALRGWDLVVRLDLRGEVLRLALEDLRRIGVLVEPGAAATPVLDPVDRDLLGHLAEGATIAVAARRCGLSDRTAARHLATLRDAFAVDSTAGLLARWQASRLEHARPAPGS
jgi:hypothetical protein